jgi:hypothetical protein
MGKSGYKVAKMLKTRLFWVYWSKIDTVLNMQENE